MSQDDFIPTTVIREMREDDTVHVHQIHTDCLTVSLKNYYSTAELEAWMYGRSPEGYWRFANSGETFRVAERAGEIDAIPAARARDVQFHHEVGYSLIEHRIRIDVVNVFQPLRSRS